LKDNLNNLCASKFMQVFYLTNFFKVINHGFVYYLYLFLTPLIDKGQSSPNLCAPDITATGKIELGILSLFLFKKSANLDSSNSTKTISY